MLLSTGRDLAVTVNKSTGAATFKGNSFFQVSNLKLSGSISYSGTPDTGSGFSYVLNKINLSLYKYPEGNKVGIFEREQKVLLEFSHSFLLKHLETPDFCLRFLLDES